MNVTFSLLGLTFEAEAYIEPFVRGKYSGPPETCYPDEGGYAEVSALTCNGANAMFLMDSELKDEIEGAVYDAAEKAAEHARQEAQADAAAERAYERSKGY